LPSDASPREPIGWRRCPSHHPPASPNWADAKRDGAVPRQPRAGLQRDWGFNRRGRTGRDLPRWTRSTTSVGVGRRRPSASETGHSVADRSSWIRIDKGEKRQARHAKKSLTLQARVRYAVEGEVDTEDYILALRERGDRRRDGRKIVRCRARRHHRRGSCRTRCANGGRLPEHRPTT